VCLPISGAIDEFNMFEARLVGRLACSHGRHVIANALSPAEAQSQQSQTSLPEDAQVRLCDQAALSGSDAQRVKECLPLVWAEDAKIRARSREVFSQAIHSINGSLHWPRKPLPRVPNPYIVEGACPGEGCRYGVFFPEQPVKLYDRPKGEPLGKQIERGERIAVLTGKLYVTPVKGVVKRSHGRLQQGEAIYMLDYVGEGTSNYLVKGRVVQGLEDYCSWEVCPNIVHFDGKYSMLPEDSSQTAPQQYWWKVQRRDGSQGWLSVYDAGPLYYYTDAEIIGSPPDIPDPFDYTTQGIKAEGLSNAALLHSGLSASQQEDLRGSIAGTSNQTGAYYHVLPEKTTPPIQNLWGYDETLPAGSRLTQNSVSHFKPFDSMALRVGNESKKLHSFANLNENGTYDVEGDFQCTALISQYLSLLGFKKAPTALPNGRDVVTRLAEGANKEFFSPIDATQPPRVGSIISMEAGASGIADQIGHVAIVKGVTVVNENRIFVNLIEQNIKNPGTNQFSVNRTIEFLKGSDGTWSAKHSLTKDSPYSYSVLNWTTPTKLP
jgi:hypothetical protein